jgi:hypothetical protein
MIFRGQVIPGAHKSSSSAKKIGTAAASVLLANQLTLRWNFQFHGFDAVGIVIPDSVDPSAHRAATHRIQPSDLLSQGGQPFDLHTGPVGRNACRRFCALANAY